MEGISASMYSRMKSYWRRKGYERLNGLGRTRRNRPVGLGSSGTAPARRRFRWRIKIKPKLKIFKMSSPKKFFVWLRDAYVKMMLGVANSRGMMGSAGYGGVAGDGFGAFGARPMKEYDEKVIIEIYKSLMGQLVPRDAARLGSTPKLTAILE